MDIAFITVNYNTKKLLEDLVVFFNSTTFPFSHRLVVVDNNSADGSVAFLAESPGIVPILNQDNVGYGRAVNQGIAATASRYVCVLNTDLVLNREALVALWEHLENNSNIGLACPLICDPGTLRIQHFIFHESMLELYVDSVFRWKSRALKRRVSDSKRPVSVEGVMGSFLFLRRSLIDHEKLFDESFNFYYEDNDLAHRLKDQGVQCQVLPQQRIIHLGGQSSSSLSTSSVAMGNRYRYLEKHFGHSHARNIFRLEYLRSWAILQKYRLRGLLLRRDTDIRKTAAIQVQCIEMSKFFS